MQNEFVNEPSYFFRNLDGEYIEITTEKLTDKSFLTSDYNGKFWHFVSDISGKSTAIRIPDYIVVSNLSHVHLKSVWLGEWETPQSERERGFLLRAVCKNGMDQHIESFYLDRMSEDEILEISESFSKYIGVRLSC